MPKLVNISKMIIWFLVVVIFLSVNLLIYYFTIPSEVAQYRNEILIAIIFGSIGIVPMFFGKNLFALFYLSLYTVGNYMYNSAEHEPVYSILPFWRNQFFYMLIGIMVGLFAEFLKRKLKK